jgi:alpha-methylacyl-CoA racemase
MKPLHGVRVIEMAGLGPGPYCAMLLADMGADVVRVDRPGGGALPGAPDPERDVLNRGRRSIALDLKDPDAVRTLLALVEKADALVEGYRPGVMERLGLGPEACHARNPALVYGRMTGWGQHGPLAPRAGHDINYIALSGALHAIGPADGVPVPPLNLVGDFGGGGMLLAFGLLCALLEARRCGRGRVVDAAMSDGSASLMTIIYGLHASGLWHDARGRNLLDGGAPYYGCYRCADGGHVAVGALEPAFYRDLLDLLGLADGPEWRQDDVALWPEQRRRFAEIFATRPRDVWAALAEGRDCCLTPVLSLAEAPDHPHNRARGTFVAHAGIVQPAPVPRFGPQAPAIDRAPPRPGQDGAAILRDWGVASPSSGGGEATAVAIERL